MNIYLAGYKHFGECSDDYGILCSTCSSILKRYDKDSITFFVTETSEESGDMTCSRYVKENGFKSEDWLPSSIFKPFKQETLKNGNSREYYEKLKEFKFDYISKSDHVILFSDYDNDNKGISTAFRMAAKSRVEYITLVYPKNNTAHVFWRQKPDRYFVYEITPDNFRFIESKKRTGQ